MVTKVPPNGGWGWLIVLAGALNAISTVPIVQGFGLIFKDFASVLNMSATDTSIIINVNLAFGMILGLINGPLLKTLGYRKVAIIGSILYSIGITLTAFSYTFVLIIISYGLLTSIGMIVSMSGFSLAINSYFTTKRGRAMGLTVTMTGLGPIFMPQVTAMLLSFYGIQGTVLIFGAYSLHSLIGALLLQPVKWHMKDAPLCLETVAESPQIPINDKEDKSDQEKEEEIDIYPPTSTTNSYQRKRKMTISSVDYDIEVGSIYGFDTPLPHRTSVDRTMSYDADYDDEMSMVNETNSRDKYSRHPWWNSTKSMESINLGSSIKIFDEPIPITKKLTFVDVNDASNKTNGVNQDPLERDSLLERKSDIPITETGNNNESTARRIWRRIIDLYDFDLLRDPIYVNIMLGMSIAVFAEINFSMLTPFILADMNMTTAKIANVMSVIAIVDLVCRGAAPFLGEWLHQPPRIMYMISLILLIISRTSLIFVDEFVAVLVVAVGLGAAKGIRSVYMTLVIPTYVPIHKLPNASGIQMLTNGMILICAGPVLGLLRDITGSYTICIILMNCVTAVTIIMWTIEILLIRRRK